MPPIYDRYHGLVRHFSVKEGVDIADLFYLPLSLSQMFFDFCLKAEELDMPMVVITRIVDDKIAGVSVSDSHRGRAIDIRSREWNPSAIKKIVEYINTKYSNIGAISASDGKSKAIVYHDGTANHFHLSVKSGVV